MTHRHETPEDIANDYGVDVGDLDIIRDRVEAWEDSPEALRRATERHERRMEELEEKNREAARNREPESDGEAFALTVIAWVSMIAFGWIMVPALVLDGLASLIGNLFTD